MSEHGDMLREASELIEQVGDETAGLVQDICWDVSSTLKTLAINVDVMERDDDE